MVGNVPGRKAGPRVSALSRVVADNVRLICARRKITQVELAALLGISKMSVSDRFRYITPYTLDDLGLIAGYLDVPIAVLVGEALDVDGETSGAGPLLALPIARAVRRGPASRGQALPLGEFGAVG